MGNSLIEKGLISRKEVTATVTANGGQGIRFKLENANNHVEAKLSNLFSTQRNTVLSKNNDCICLTEHFLAACALLKITNIDVELSEPELPFGDGSAEFWLGFLQDLDLPAECFDKREFVLNEEITICDENDNSRFIKILPSDVFKIGYKMDWDHPALGKQDYTWSTQDPIKEIAEARTFSNEAENIALGLSGWVLGFNEKGFIQDLYAENEPARHKALDLLGDLMLSGVNPLSIKMSILSNKGGHELNSKAATKLKEVFNA